MHISEVGGVSPLMDPPTGKSCSVFVSCVACAAVRKASLIPSLCLPGRCPVGVPMVCSSSSSPLPAGVPMVPRWCPVSR